MKKYYQLLAFAAGLTMLAYTGCGANSEMNETLTADSSSAAGIAADFAEEAVKNDAVVSAAPAAEEAAPALDDAAPAEYAGDFADAEDFGGDAEIAFSPEAVADGAEAALSAVKSDDVLNSAAVAGEAVPEEAVIEPEPVPEPEPAPEPERESAVGMLTAGQWNDHENWGFFSNLVNTGLIEFPCFGLDPTQRIAVTVTDSSGTPLPNVEVILNSDTQAIWRAVTDQNGKAYVFDTDHTGSSLTASQGEISQTVSDLFENIADEQGNIQTGDLSYEFVLDTEQKLYHDTQIMFIVDTTGSMGDEMLYLQSDFSAIAEEAGDENTTYSVNFYKDEGDEYVTDCSGFTSDLQAIRNKLNDEFASGGGDEPEAVYEVLKETMFSPEWDAESVKIAFLIYDAPPHDGTEFEAIVEEASAKGIHVIPVVSSNGSRATEIFGRALAICTNGSYVFLTDDSGIGDSHLEPIIGDYQVESLHDIIVRIIQDYKQ